MARAINLIIAAVLAAAALAAAISLAKAETAANLSSHVCAERLCGVVLF
ncbi:MAG: hypothetical protein R3C51_07700 [Parvularculaceae bacterium]